MMPAFPSIEDCKILNKAFLPIMAVLAVLVSSCSANKYQLYDGPPRPQSEVAVLVKGTGDFVYLATIDGNKEPYSKNKSFYGNEWDGDYRIELAPGTHVLSFYYIHPNGYKSTRNIEVAIDARPGKTYVTRSDEPRKASQGATWNAWVEVQKPDEADGKP